MVVEDFDLGYWADVVVAYSALTCGSVHDAAAQHERTGAAWPVSGDATVRAGTVVKRALPPFYLLQRPLRAVAGGWLQRSPAPAALYCGHGPMDACRCTVQA